MSSIRCFWLNPTTRAFESLVVRGPGDKKCPEAPFYHVAMIRGAEKEITELQRDREIGKPHWPTHCSRCNYPFVESDFRERVLIRVYEGVAGNGRKFHGSVSDAPIGAMYDATELADEHKGHDGRCLFVLTPGGWWPVDLPDGVGIRFKRSGEVPAVTVEGDVTVPNSNGTWCGRLVDGQLVSAPPPGAQ